ncbi:hypothetical protein [Nostoc sp.]|uniref:hypothetical protein n=1 Tax=Nostoc sp. TaxID=1180 RepID=UPI002FFCF349
MLGFTSSIQASVYRLWRSVVRSLFYSQADLHMKIVRKSPSSLDKSEDLISLDEWKIVKIFTRLLLTK